MISLGIVQNKRGAHRLEKQVFCPKSFIENRIYSEFMVLILYNQMSLVDKISTIVLPVLRIIRLAVHRRYLCFFGTKYQVSTCGIKFHSDFVPSLVPGTCIKHNGRPTLALPHIPTSSFNFWQIP